MPTSRAPGKQDLIPLTGFGAATHIANEAESHGHLQFNLLFGVSQCRYNVAINSDLVDETRRKILLSRSE